MRRALSLLCLFALGLPACQDSSPKEDPQPDLGADLPSQDMGQAPDGDGEPDSGDLGQPDAADLEEEPPNPDCDPINPGVCAMPWPSNLYLEPDAARPTGYTLAFGQTSLPANGAGKHVEPEAWRRLDGYSVASPLMAWFPYLDGSSLPGEDQMERSMDQDAAILWFEVQPDGGLERVPYWAELDVQEPLPRRKTLEIYPGRLLKHNTRYIAAIRRGLRTVEGDLIEPSEAFARLLAEDTAGDPLLEPRQQRFNEVFDLLQSQAGVPRQDLLLAWDFVTNSSQELHRRVLHMRDQGLELVGEDGAELTFTQIQEFAPEEDGSGRPVHPYIALRIEGTFRVPDYTRQETAPEGTGRPLNLGQDGLPVQNGWREAPFWALVPHSALDGEPVDLMMYGHGLLGTGEQVFGGKRPQLAHEHRFVLVAPSWTGMANEDFPVAVAATADMSHFVWMGDRLHQGMMEFVLLARGALRRMPAMAEIADRGISLSDQIYYSGISQGGIFGGTFVALSPDVRRGHLGVPGNHYQVMIQRSVDFVPYQLGIQASYNFRPDQKILLPLVQLLWDQTDPVTYYHHLEREPFPGNEPSTVLLGLAKGDWQVPMIVNEVMARSDVGLAVMEGYGRPLYGIQEQPYPRQGSGIVMYDFGNPWPPSSNQPPEPHELGDPHNKPGSSDHHNAQLAHFLRTGEIIDVCGGDGCTPE